jgi:teichuronic acid biosynthesis glycosyltransferase TuaG
MGNLVSVILPVFNGEAYLRCAIQSVIQQTLTSWELLVINDGSTDCTTEIALSFADSRIRYFEQLNKGVSAARNVGLENMRGDFFCFLDADDVLPANSLKARCDIFAQDPSAEFVDGKVEIERIDDGKPIRTYSPSFNGPPFNELLRINNACFCGLTWMIRRKPHRNYRMNSQQTHCEDLLFFLELSRDGGPFTFTNECVLRYRRRTDSAMSDLSGLDNGYLFISRLIKSWPQVRPAQRIMFWLKTRKIMFLSYLFDRHSPMRAILCLTRF